MSNGSMNLVYSGNLFTRWQLFVSLLDKNFHVKFCYYRTINCKKTGKSSAWHATKSILSNILSKHRITFQTWSLVSHITTLSPTKFFFTGFLFSSHLFPRQSCLVLLALFLYLPLTLVHSNMNSGSFFFFFFFLVFCSGYQWLLVSAFKEYFFVSYLIWPFSGFWTFDNTLLDIFSHVGSWDLILSWLFSLLLLSLLCRLITY